VIIADPLHQLSAGFWTFDDGVGENFGRGKHYTGDAIIGSGGRIISVPERSGKVIQCTGYDCFKFDVSNTPCLR